LKEIAGSHLSERSAGERVNAAVAPIRHGAGSAISSESPDVRATVVSAMTAFALLTGSGARAGQSLDVRILIGWGSGGSVTIQAFIDRDDRNRSIEFVVDSASYFGSSTKDLDGEHAPHTTEVRFRSLPIGDYVARIELRGTNGVRGVVRREFIVQ
jgi:hypothetical protein